MFVRRLRYGFALRLNSSMLTPSGASMNAMRVVALLSCASTLNGTLAGDALVQAGTLSRSKMVHPFVTDPHAFSEMQDDQFPDIARQTAVEPE